MDVNSGRAAHKFLVDNTSSDNDKLVNTFMIDHKVEFAVITVAMEEMLAANDPDRIIDIIRILLHVGVKLGKDSE